MVAQRRRAGSDAPGPGAEHIRVVYPGYNHSWAVWITQQLESHGCHVTSQRWDPAPNQPLEEALEDLLRGTDRVMLVLSDWFFLLGPRREPEWNTVLRGFVADHADRFAAVNVSNRPLLPAAAVLNPPELRSVGAEEAERRLLHRIGLAPLRQPSRPAAGTAFRFPNLPPPVQEIPRRNSRFTGRDELLNQLQRRLMDAEPGAAVCTLVGMSGIGKTQIAVEYAHRFGPEYDVVWWVSSDQRNTQREGLGELAVRLGLTSDSETGKRIRVLQESLRRGEPYQRWLIVFDGWEDTDEAASYLPRGGPGHVLITSRNHAWRASTDAVEIPGFLRSESTSYLMRGAPHISPAEADQVAAEFQDVPLQLAHAAALLGQEHMDVSEYLRMVRQSGFAALEGRTLPDDYPRSSNTSWSILLNKLRQNEPRTMELLALCTAFAPRRIPIGLVHVLPPAELPEGLRWIHQDHAAWGRALDSLANYSVLTREPQQAGPAEEPDPQHECVYMHSMAHQIVRELLDGPDQDSYRHTVSRLLAAADPGDAASSKHWPRYAELLPHLRHCGALGSTERQVRRMVLNCLRYCFFRGEYQDGARLAEQIREQWSELSRPDDPHMHLLTTLQGNILRSAGRFREAYDLDRARLELLHSATAPDEEVLMRATSCLAADQRFLGRYPEALRMQEEVVGTAHRLLGPEDGETMLAQNNLATGLRLVGDYRRAYAVDLEVLGKRESTLGARHPDTLMSGNSCARDLRLLGQYREALGRQQLVVQLLTQEQGPHHPKTLWARHNLAMCERREGAGVPAAGAALAGLLEEHEQVYGRGHFTTLALITDFGNYLREHGDVPRAHDLITEAENGYRALVGQAHPVPTAMQSNVGLILQAEGDREGALNMFVQAQNGLLTTLSEDHPVVLGCALNTASGYSFLGRVEEAEEQSRNALERTSRTLGEDHPLTLACMVSLSWDLRSLGERTEAEKIEKDALQRMNRTLGPQHPDTLAARQRNRPYWDFEPYLG